MKGITISSSLPSISGNFDEIRDELQNQLKQFDLIVDVDSVKTAKSMAIQINKLSGEIDEKRKQIVKELSAPIKEFEVKMKELKNLCQDSRQNLLSQVKVYDDKKLVKVKKLLSQELQNKYTHHGVKQEFQTVTIKDLVILSNLTNGGALAKKARDTIDERVSQAKKLQEKIDTRLLTLGEICFKCGLPCPLTRENINHFLFENNDDIYLEKLTSLIKSEINRLRLADEQKRKQEEIKKEVEKRVQLTTMTKQAATTQHRQDKTLIKNSKNEALFGASRKRKFLVTATFEFEMDKKYEGEIKNLMLKKFEAAKFKTLPRVEVMAI